MSCGLGRARNFCSHCRSEAEDVLVNPCRRGSSAPSGAAVSTTSKKKKTSRRISLLAGWRHSPGTLPPSGSRGCVHQLCQPISPQEGSRRLTYAEWKTKCIKFLITCDRCAGRRAVRAHSTVVLLVDRPQLGRAEGPAAAPHSRQCPTGTNPYSC